MITQTLAKPVAAKPGISAIRSNRIASIDLLRGIVMIIMALDHVRDYFHRDVFLYDPTDLSQTNVFLFFTRWITHFCAPVFVFLAGISANLYGSKRSRKELAVFLLTRGLWLLFAELFIITLEWSFNPTYPYLNLQVIWAIGISMIALSGFIYFNRSVLLILSLVIIGGHNLLDNVHFQPGSGSYNVWSLFHETPRDLYFGHIRVRLLFPALPWIGILALGYYFGNFFRSGFDREKRKRLLLQIGTGAIILFVLLRSVNVYGDFALWSPQPSAIFSFLSFINVTKYPPSLLYTLITLGPALLFLALSEKPLNSLTEKLTMFGRVAFFYYMAHLFLVHLLAVFGAMVEGYRWTSMILSYKVSKSLELKGYGYNILTVYIIWISVILILYPFCKWFDRYKRTNLPRKPWLSYI